MEKPYIKRELESKIRKYMKNKEIIAIVGARQCGKTTIMQHIFKDLKNAKFITFEDRDILELFSDDIKEFVKRYIKDVNYLFIDEFQYAKQGGKQLKFIYDTEDTKVIISGSSAVDLSVQSLKYLVGRILVFNLSPLSFYEFLRYKDEKLYNSINLKKMSDVMIRMINILYYEFLVYGGYPNVVLENNGEKKQEILKNIYNTYILREVKEILQISDDEKVNKIIKALALQINNLVNFNEICTILNLSFHELKKYFDILIKTFVCLESKPYFRNKRKELAKSPKVYFLDNGFRNVAINNFQDIRGRSDVGALNENFIASEISKNGINLNYWRTKAGAEVDFVIEKQGQIIPIEVKTILKYTKYGKSIKNFSKEYKAKQGFILSLDFQSEKKIDNTLIKFRPLFTIGKIL